nr:MAG TPA: hypothetical protein [Caudoviricetes sp.]
MNCYSIKRAHRCKARGFFPPRAVRPYWPGGRLYLGKEGF